MSLKIEQFDRVRVITINRPQARNAVDGPTANLLADAFREFDADPGSDADPGGGICGARERDDDAADGGRRRNGQV